MNCSVLQHRLGSHSAASKIRRTVSGLVAVFCFIASLHAQLAVPPRDVTPKPPSEEGDSVTTLSPFLVRTSGNDIGYYTENTLAGSRLSTNLGDLAASITVVTRQQMVDTSSVDINDVFMYEANTEGTESSYTSYRYNGAQFEDFTQENPTTANRIRGISSATRSHNFYYSIASIPFDVYNTESVEINRGPNSLLFGLGSASGVVNQSSTKANVTKFSGEADARYGRWDSFRQSLRFNYPIIRDRLGVFVAVLNDKRGYERKPSYNNAHRQYAAITWQPTSKTTVTGNFEHYSGYSRMPNTTTPQDGITEWRAAGSPTWNPLTFTVTTSNGNRTVLPNSNVNNIPGLQSGKDTTPWMYYDNHNAVFWTQAALSATAVTGPFPNTLPQLAISSTSILKNQGSTQPLFNVPGITNRALYDWSSINIASEVHYSDKANIYNVEIHQELLPHLFAQLGWYRENYLYANRPYNAPGTIVVDPNVVQLDGSPNPFFQRPLFTFNGGQTNQSGFSRNDNYRLNLAYVLDFTRDSGWKKWLGLNRLFAFGETHSLHNRGFSSGMVVVDNHTWANPVAKVANAPGSIAVSTTIQHYMVVGPANGGITTDPGYTIDGSFTIPLHHATPVAGGGFNWVNEPARLEQGLNGGGNNDTWERDDSLTLGWQGSLLKGKIVPTVGLRRDRDVSQATSRLVANPATGFLDTAGLNVYGPGLYIYGITRTAGVVVKPLPWLSLSYDKSRNFTPAGLSTNLFGQPLPLPTGKGEDFGIRFNFGENKFVLGVDYFRNDANDARGTPADSVIARLGDMDRSFINWANQVETQLLGPGASSAAIANAIATVTQQPVGYLPPSSGIGTTSALASRGTEIQLIYNPIPNWNFKATMGLQRTTYSRIAPEYNAYVAQRLAVWMNATAGGQQFWSTPSVNGLLPNIGVGTIPSAHFLGSIQAPMQLAQALQGKRTQGQRAWSAAGISTYRFASGPLKGLRIGGGVRLLDHAIIGYRGKADPDGVVRSLDPNQPVYDHVNPAFDAWISRTFQLPRFLGQNIKMKVQLNVKNLTEKGNWLQAININPDGSPLAFRIVDPRSWYLDVDFQF